MEKTTFKVRLIILQETMMGEVELNRKIKSVIDNLPDTFEDLTGKGKSAEEE